MKRAFCVSGVCLGVVVIFNGSVVSMKVYEIAKQKRKGFCFNQRQLRSLMNGISRCDGSHCWNEMLQPNALEQLLERILVRIVNGQTYIPFRQGVRGSGILLLTMAIRNQRGGVFALSIYRRPEEYIFRVYDPQSYCSMLYGTSELDLLKWLFEDMKHFRRRCGPCTKLQETQKRKELCMWLSKIIYIEEDPNVGFQRILLQREADKERANRLACRVQTLFRSLAARARSRLLLRRDYEKVFDRNYRAYYYTNKDNRSLAMEQNPCFSVTTTWICPTMNGGGSKQGRRTTTMHACTTITPQQAKPAGCAKKMPRSCCNVASVAF